MASLRVANEEDVSARFQADISKHQLTILRDDAVNRHLRFRRPATGCMGFDILTWAGHLCYTGDMGTWVFSRLQDMFEFFRGEHINPAYWAEKTLAVDRHAGLSKFSAECFQENVLKELEGVSPDDIERAKDEVLSCAHDGEYRAYDAAINFQAGDGSYPMQDFWELNCREFGFLYLWACHAIQWGIAQYDKAKEGGPPRREKGPR